MKRIIVLVPVLILGFGSLGFANNQYSRMVEKVVVDKIIRNQPLYNNVVLTTDCIQKIWNTPVNLMTSEVLEGKVADLPAAPSLRVDRRSDSPGLTEAGQVVSKKKYIWGIPAGTALRKDQSIPREETVNDRPVRAVQFPHSMIFQWGANTDQ